MGDEAQQMEYLSKIDEENKALEAEIARLEAEKAQAATKPMVTKMMGTKAPGTGICVLDFGALDHAESAGIDRGSSFRPPQCGHRTQIGGFYTS